MNSAEKPTSNKPEPICPSTSLMPSLRSSKLRMSASDITNAATKSRRAAAAGLPSSRRRWRCCTRLRGCTSPVEASAASGTSTGAAPMRPSRTASSSLSEPSPAAAGASLKRPNSG
jgi:hypothetical protein